MKHVHSAIVVAEGYQAILIILVEVIQGVPVDGMANNLTGILVINQEFVYFGPLVFDTVILWTSFDRFNRSEVIHHEEVFLARDVQYLWLLFVFDVDVTAETGSLEDRARCFLDLHPSLGMIKIIRTYHKSEHIVALNSY